MFSDCVKVAVLNVEFALFRYVKALALQIAELKTLL